MSDVRKVFISATSTDLKRYREVVRDTLLTRDLFPVMQELFSPSHESLYLYLRDRIGQCEIVICLVGNVFGAWEHPVTQHKMLQREESEI